MLYKEFKFERYETFIIYCMSCFGICKKHFSKGMYTYSNAYQKSELV